MDILDGETEAPDDWEYDRAFGSETRKAPPALPAGVLLRQSEKPLGASDRSYDGWGSISWEESPPIRHEAVSVSEAHVPRYEDDSFNCVVRGQRNAARLSLRGESFLYLHQAGQPSHGAPRNRYSKAISASVGTMFTSLPPAEDDGIAVKSV